MSDTQFKEKKDENDFSTVYYNCPTCGQKMGVEPHLFNETVTCPNCEHSFKIEPPTAKPSDTYPDNPTEIPHISSEANEETTLATFHPAMFRAHPMRHMMLVLGMIAGGFGLVYAFVVALDPITFWIITSIALVIGLVSAGAMLIWWLKTIATTLTVTSKRTTVWRGIIAKETSEVQHDDVRNIQIDQSVLERLLGVGKIAISSSGQDGLEVVVKGVPTPADIAAMIRRRQ